MMVVLKYSLMGLLALSVYAQGGGAASVVSQRSKSSVVSAIPSVLF
ncbi:hypothetical protein [Fibrobacter intestinalis]|nr:hypothetical protein [Fibrobacter intestinalis]